jgi:[glutamine synthetase] adenylyltransferase / [glutamine synthetase]-adenylyl-L-tyrosine phosphorylase
MTRSQPMDETAATNEVSPDDLPRYSRFLQRLHRRYHDVLPLLPPGMPTRDGLAAAFVNLQATGLDTSAALRVLRQLTMERLAQLDCRGQASLEEVTHGMTWLAEVTLDIAWQQVSADLDALHGQPFTFSGQRAQMWVIGMGKLGARELNVSSDIDLIYVYDEDGQSLGNSEGRNKVSCQEYFTRAVKRMYALIGDTTEHGFVFRVDLALRPNGNSGPSVVSLGAGGVFAGAGPRVGAFCLDEKPCGGPPQRCAQWFALALRSVVLPFVFRRYLDYNVFESLRTLHQQIRDHAAKRSAGHPERANDVKLSRGGIREIEFTVQLLQVVRGGQFPELRTRPTLDALQRVAKAGLMPQATAEALSAAYVFLRQVEHRIQYLDDQQTHVLPTRDDDLAWIAQTLGLSGARAFLWIWTHTARWSRKSSTPCWAVTAIARVANGKTGKNTREHADLDAVLTDFSGRGARTFGAVGGQPTVQALRDDARGRLMRLLQRTAQWLDDGRVTEEAVLRMVDWIEPCCAVKAIWR